MKSYKYSVGNLIENPNTYFYSEYAGMDFIESWKKSRNSALKKIEDLEVCLSSIQERGCLFGNPLLNELLNQAREYRNDLRVPVKIELLLQRFEVTKRIYDDYSEEMRAINREAYRNTDNYIHVALIFETYYSKTQDIRFFNALIKLMDIICSESFSFKPALGLICADLLSKESQHFSRLCKSFK